MRGVSESVIALVPVSGVAGAGDRFGRGPAGGAALGSVDRTAIPGIANGTGQLRLQRDMGYLELLTQHGRERLHTGLPISEIRGLDMRGERGQPGGHRPDVEIVDPFDPG